ncbi:Scr1 family TA system antitoxin-like transcriptional regulator [Nocardia sp. NBC_01327]|uniref:Scr1 family TA system antitoxin-like transcriptional regulator n=1 Tax=Nocardia sp. NBC_01327 TaxID=2903593 RepID=UPI002E11F0F6|nr:Scr1 family TA system antitoxin-like transcriptional regulator [Nocardia sp. NBC_01327]
MAPSSPIVARWELMLRLRERRLELDIGPAAIAKKLRISSGYWSHIEGERNLLSEDKLRVLLHWLEFDDDEKRELLQLRVVARQRAWWSHYSGLFGADQLRLIGLEHGAQTIQTYETVVFPGLLQAEPYARAIIASAVGSVRPAEVDQRVAVRMLRQQRLGGDDPIRLIAVIGQAALVHETGGPEVLRQQLDHIAQLIQQHPDTLDVRVIPFSCREGNALGGATFHLLDFENTRLPTLAWQESAVAGETTDNDIRIRELSYAFGQVQSIALDQESSLNLIRRSARELESRA